MLGFKYGAENSLAVSARERKRGVPVEIVGCRVDDPAGLVTALGRVGVAAEGSLPAAMLAVYGEASPAETAAARAKADQALRKAKLLMAGVAVACVVLGAARIHQNDTGTEMFDHVVRQSLMAFVLVVATVVAALVIPLPAQRRSRPVGEAPTGIVPVLKRLSLLGIIGGLFVGGIVLRNLGVSTFFAFAPALAAPASAILWFVVRAGRSEAAEVTGAGAAGDTEVAAADGAGAMGSGTGIPPSPYRR